MPRKSAVSAPDIVSSMKSFLWSGLLGYFLFNSSMRLDSALELAPSRKSFAALSEVDAQKN